MRWFCARAKVNLTLRVRGRRADGYHELESLVAFAGACDWLGYEPGPALALDVAGPNAELTGPPDDNVVLRAGRELASRVEGLKLGRFRLIKLLPAAAGLGGGSADAAAALRALADHNGLTVDDDRIRGAAAATGADVPVCLESRARTMAGIGERLGPPVSLGLWFALLVNPRVPTSTKDVFRVYDRMTEGVDPAIPDAPARLEDGLPPAMQAVLATANDLQAPAIAVTPVINDVIEALRNIPDARLVRMSGSGATCFALFESRESAAAARLTIRADHPDWWTAATSLR